MWNYRIVRKKVQKHADGTPWTGEELFQFGIHEAYCDKNGKVWAITVNPEDLVVFDAWKELEKDTPEAMLKQTLEWMLKACDKPILEYDKIPEDGAETPGYEDE